jgi:hypothetical protein
MNVLRSCCERSEFFPEGPTRARGAGQPKLDQWLRPRWHNDANPFGAVIRCTWGSDVDNKTISKRARALRYVARFTETRIGLKAFMKEAGGVNACADRYAKLVSHR